MLIQFFFYLLQLKMEIGAGTFYPLHSAVKDA